MICCQGNQISSQNNSSFMPTSLIIGKSYAHNNQDQFIATEAIMFQDLNNPELYGFMHHMNTAERII